MCKPSGMDGWVVAHVTDGTAGTNRTHESPVRCERSRHRSNFEPLVVGRGVILTHQGAVLRPVCDLTPTGPD
jgi:hypothetical protein